MKLLLTSAGIKNTSIHDALVDLLGKSIAESSALFIPTAIYPFPGGAGMAWQAICGRAQSPLCELGWKSLGVLELTALPTIKEESWVPMVRETDALLVWGGDVLYLYHWMRQSGLADLLPSLSESVYVGVSAGSIVVTPYNCDAAFDLEFVPDGSDMTVGACRPGAGTGRLHALPAPRSQGHAGHFSGQHREVGVWHPGPDVRDRRRHGHQGDRRRDRSRLRGTLAAVPSRQRAIAAGKNSGAGGLAVQYGPGHDLG